VAVYLLAVSSVQYVNRRSLEGRVAIARLAVATCLLVLVVLGGSLSPPALAAAVGLILFVLTAFETVYAERPAESAEEKP